MVKGPKLVEEFRKDNEYLEDRTVVVLEVS